MSDFNCNYCVRPEVSGTPRSDEDGVYLWDYNNRRYQHYLDGFYDQLDLARHLNDRMHYWAETSSGEGQAAIKATGFAANASTLAWWKLARQQTVGRHDVPSLRAVPSLTAVEPLAAEPLAA